MLRQPRRSSSRAFACSLRCSIWRRWFRRRPASASDTRVLPDRVGAGACDGRVLGQGLQFSQARADFQALGADRRDRTRRFLELGLACRQLFRCVDAGDARLQAAHFRGQLADGEGQRIFLRFQCRQGLLDRLQALGFTGGAEAVARRFHK
jgi:hypothetical protein